MRGEHGLERVSASSVCRSSPHARGTPLAEDHQLVARPLIPACAGNTRRSLNLTMPCAAHPRMRGEHLTLPVRCCPCVRSSPRMRETRVMWSGSISKFPLIPACAGNTALGTAVPAIGTAHPRMRGEHCTVYCSGVTRSRSSPHARGTPFPQAIGYQEELSLTICHRQKPSG